MINIASNIHVPKIDATVINNVNKLNVLGIIIDDHLSWKKQKKKMPTNVLKQSEFLINSNIVKLTLCSTFNTLGRSNHNVVHLLPKYRQKLKQEPPQIHTIKHWTPDSTETIRGCFEATDWNVFFDSCQSDQDALTDTITSYIILCEDPSIPTKEVCIYPNNKLWIGKDLKQCLNEKKIAFLQKNRKLGN